MKKYKWVFVVITFFLLGYGAYRFFIFPILFPTDAEIKQYVRDNLAFIRTIDPYDDDFKDFKAIEKSIGDASVVLLGEQDHGDAATFQAKSRLIKFLHQKMGFDVLIFESDFYGLSRSWDLTKSGKAPINEYRHNIYPLWANCAECSDLFKYIESHFDTANEITVAGADPIHSGKYSSENLLAEVEEMIEEKQLIQNIEERQLFLDVLRETLNEGYESVVTKHQKKFFLSTLDTMEERLEKDSFWHQELRNLNGFVLNAWDSLESNNYRDIQMGDNMMWLINHKFKDKKVIFWGSNSHIFKDFGQMGVHGPYNDGKDTINTGTYLHRLLQEDLYVLGFTSYHGNAGRLYGQPFEIQKPLPHYFESWIHESGTPYGFVDFRDARYRDEERYFWMKALLHRSNLVNWFNLFDGVFYIEEMYPCEEDKTWWKLE